MIDSINRRIRGYSIIKNGSEPVIINTETFLVPSQTDKNKKYRVVHDKIWSCECPDFNYRRVKCKHIHAVELWLNLRATMQSQDVFESFMREPDSCLFCNSKNVVKNGIIRNKNKDDAQRFLCKDCGKTFVNNRGFNKLRANPKVVIMTLDLFFKGLSLRKIQDHSKQFYQIDVSYESIRRWIKRFMHVINNYVDKIKPELSDKWQVDEQKIKSKGDWRWSWNALDEGTRFLVANEVTKTRSIKNARKVFQKSKKIADKPETIKTDGLWSYEKAIKKELLSRRHPTTRHIRRCGIAKKKYNNNKVERYHENYKERTKIVRGHKSDPTAQDFNDSFRTYYNFIRPHQALNGLTPSQVAGINIGFNGNRWVEVISRALNNDYTGLPLTTPMTLVGKQRGMSSSKRFHYHDYISPRIIYTVRIFTPDGKEYDNTDKKFKTEFFSKEKAKEFIKFYKWFYPNYTFTIEEF